MSIPTPNQLAYFESLCQKMNNDTWYHSMLIGDAAILLGVSETEVRKQAVECFVTDPDPNDTILWRSGEEGQPPEEDRVSVKIPKYNLGPATIEYWAGLEVEDGWVKGMDIPWASFATEITKNAVQKRADQGKSIRWSSAQKKLVDVKKEIISEDIRN